jgi:type IV pilus assembly protein PilC
MDKEEKRQKHSRFWKKFLRLTRGRVPVLRALEVIAGEEQDVAFKTVISSVRSDMEHGVSMSEALKKHGSEFSLSVIELVRMAEKTGAWDEILQEITDGLSEGTFD